MRKIRLWSCMGIVAGVALSASAMAQQNGRLTDASPAFTTGGNAVAPKPVQLQAPNSLPAPVLAQATPIPVPAAPVAPVATAVAAPVATPAIPPAAPAQKKGVGVWWDITPVGDTTRELMAAQAAGEQASTTALPTLGVTASESWNRYLESFRHPVPEWFKQHVEALE